MHEAKPAPASSNAGVTCENCGHNRSGACSAVAPAGGACPECGRLFRSKASRTATWQDGPLEPVAGLLAMSILVYPWVLNAGFMLLLVFADAGGGWNASWLILGGVAFIVVLAGLLNLPLARRLGRNLQHFGLVLPAPVLRYGLPIALAVAQCLLAAAYFSGCAMVCLNDLH